MLDGMAEVALYHIEVKLFPYAGKCISALFIRSFRKTSSHSPPRSLHVLHTQHEQLPMSRVSQYKLYPLLCHDRLCTRIRLLPADETTALSIVFQSVCWETDVKNGGAEWIEGNRKPEKQVISISLLRSRTKRSDLRVWCG